MENKEISRDIRLISLDISEVVRWGWGKDSVLSRLIEKVEEVFWFDANAHTYVAELTPSYQLNYVRTDVHWRDNWECYLSEGERDEIEYELGLRDQFVDYAHVSTIDALVAKRIEEGRGHRQVPIDEDVETETELEQAVFEYASGSYWE